MKQATTLGERLLQLRSEQETLLAQRQQALSDLHVAYGFASRSELIAALQELDHTKPSQGAAARAPEANGTRKPRAVITPAIRKRVVALAKQKMSDRKIAAEVGISRPSVQNIKRAAGLTRPANGKSAVKPAKAKPKARAKARKPKAVPATPATPATQTPAPVPAPVPTAPPAPVPQGA